MEAEGIKQVLEFGRDAATPEVLTVTHEGDAVQVIARPAGPGQVQLISIKPFLDEFRTRPTRRKGTIAVDDLDSFIFLVNRDQEPNSLIFAARDAEDEPYLVAVLDFHDSVVEAEHPEPSFCENKIRYGFPLSEEWEAWTSKNGEENAMSQSDFAAFIEDHAFDLGEPEAAGATSAAFAAKLGVRLAGPSALMAVSRGLEVRSEQRIKEVRNLENGDVSLVFESNETDKYGAPLSVPSAFHIQVPIFKGGPLYSIPVRLRRRTNSGRLVWWFEMHRADLFLNDAINDALTRVRREQHPAAPPLAEGQTIADSAPPGGCGLPVVMGTPP